MNEYDTETLREELEHFRTEKEKIREVVGSIGGRVNTRRDKAINLVFAVVVISVFALGFLRYIIDINVFFPPSFYIELGVLLISLKIIWMIYRQTKVDHFQFWILNSIEFRLNSLSKQVRELKRDLEKSQTESDKQT